MCFSFYIFFCMFQSSLVLIFYVVCTFFCACERIWTWMELEASTSTFEDQSFHYFAELPPQAREDGLLILMARLLTRL